MSSSPPSPARQTIPFISFLLFFIPFFICSMICWFSSSSFLSYPINFSLHFLIVAFFACLLLLCPRIFISTSILSPFHLQIHVSVPLRRCILLDPYSLNSVPISTFQSGKLGLIVSKNTYLLSELSKIIDFCSISCIKIHLSSLVNYHLDVLYFFCVFRCFDSSRLVSFHSQTMRQVASCVNSRGEVL